MAESNPKTFEEKPIAGFETGGLKCVKDQVEKCINAWKDAELSIAVIGSSGVGKSTFINSYRDIMDDDQGAAPTGVTETTCEIRVYKDQRNPNIRLYDLPGVGTGRFPKDKYLEKVGIERFDVFVLLTASRFLENDIWLSEKIKEKEKPLFFVRNKVWLDFENKNKNRRKKIDLASVIKEIRKDCTEKMEHYKGQLYLIDCYKKEESRLDFVKLQLDIVNQLPDLKKQALLHSFTCVTPELIKQKSIMLGKDIKYAVFISGVGALNPIPGLSFSIDRALIDCMKNHFAEQLGIKEGRGGVLRSGVASATTIDMIRNISDPCTEFGADAIKQLSASETAETLSRSFSILGLIASTAISSFATYRNLTDMLDNMTEAAIKINYLIAADIAESTRV